MHDICICYDLMTVTANHNAHTYLFQIQKWNLVSTGTYRNWKKSFVQLTQLSGFELRDNLWLPVGDGWLQTCIL